MSCVPCLWRRSPTSSSRPAPTACTASPNGEHKLGHVLFDSLLVIEGAQLMADVLLQTAHRNTPGCKGSKLLHLGGAGVVVPKVVAACGVPLPRIEHFGCGSGVKCGDWLPARIHSAHGTVRNGGASCSRCCRLGCCRHISRCKGRQRLGEMRSSAPLGGACAGARRACWLHSAGLTGPHVPSGDPFAQACQGRDCCYVGSPGAEHGGAQARAALGAGAVGAAEGVVADALAAVHRVPVRHGPPTAVGGGAALRGSTGLGVHAQQRFCSRSS